MTDEAQMKAFTEACQNYEARLAEQRQYIEALELVLYKRSHVMEKDMAEALEMTMAERNSLRSQLENFDEKAAAFDEIRGILDSSPVENADQAWDKLEAIVNVVNEVNEVSEDE